MVEADSRAPSKEMIISRGQKPSINPPVISNTRKLMDIRIIRNASRDGATIGRMTVDGVWICYTLEDVVREIAGEPVEIWKVQNKTAIPRGIYQVVLSHSNHFGRVMPELLKVPGYSGIRIHSGNKSEDTEGCILVGFTIASSNTIGASKAAFTELFGQVETAINAGQKVWCHID